MTSFEIELFPLAFGVVLFAIHQLASRAGLLRGRAAQASKSEKQVDDLSIMAEKQVDDSPKSVEGNQDRDFGEPEPCSQVSGMIEPAEEPSPEPAPEDVSLGVKSRLFMPILLTLLGAAVLIGSGSLLLLSTTQAFQAEAPAIATETSASTHSAGSGKRRTKTVVEEEQPMAASPLKPSSSAVANSSNAWAMLQDEWRSSISIEPAVSLKLNKQDMLIRTASNVVYHKSAYYGNVNVGTPAKSFTVVFDTGSGHLVLPSTYCHSETCRKHTRYSRSKSRTGKDIDYDGSVVGAGEVRDQVTVTFGTGEISGVFVEDLVCTEKGSVRGVPEKKVGEQESDVPVGCMKMHLVAATEMSEDPFDNFQFDGILGLGLKGLSQTGNFNFVNMMLQSVEGWGKTLESSTFGVFLAVHKEESSEIAFGGWDSDHVDGDVFWNPVHNPELGHWIVRIRSVRVDGQVLPFCEHGCKASVDTGTTLLAVPPAVFPDLYQLMRHPAPLDGMCKGPKGPRLHIELEHFTVTLGPEDYAQPERLPAEEPYLETNEEIAAKKNTRDDLRCKPMMMSMNIPEPVGPKLFILGEPVLRKYYTVYDSERLRIGFGRANHAQRPADFDVVSDSDEDYDSWDDEDEVDEEEDEYEGYEDRS